MFSHDNFAICAARLLNKIGSAYDRLQESNGATSLAWSDDFLPKHWVAHRLQSLIEESKMMMADFAEELDRLDRERRAKLTGAAPILIPR